MIKLYFTPNLHDPQTFKLERRTHPTPECVEVSEAMAEETPQWLKIEMMGGQKVVVVDQDLKDQILGA